MKTAAESEEADPAPPQGRSKGFEGKESRAERCPQAQKRYARRPPSNSPKTLGRAPPGDTGSATTPSSTPISETASKMTEVNDTLAFAVEVKASRRRATPAVELCGSDVAQARTLIGPDGERRPMFDWLPTMMLWMLPTKWDHLALVQLVNSKYKKFLL